MEREKRGHSLEEDPDQEKENTLFLRRGRPRRLRRGERIQERVCASAGRRFDEGACCQSLAMMWTFVVLWHGLPPADEDGPLCSGSLPKFPFFLHSSLGFLSSDERLATRNFDGSWMNVISALFLLAPRLLPRYWVFNSPLRSFRRRGESRFFFSRRAIGGDFFFFLRNIQANRCL